MFDEKQASWLVKLMVALFYITILTLLILITVYITQINTNSNETNAGVARLEAA